LRQRQSSRDDIAVRNGAILYARARYGIAVAVGHVTHVGRTIKELTMLHYAVVFFVIALIAAFLGFSGIAAGAAGIAQILFFIFLVLFIVSLVAGGIGRRR
jgi:uncharacterized membrane protein YtjA (UPF0391 family)